MEPTSVVLIELAKKAAELVIPEAMRGFLGKRRRAAFDILMEELRTAKVNPEEAAARDEVAAMFVKFYQAMSQGAAFRNLRVIAKVLAHKAADATERSDDFIMWADAIGGLLHEEAVLLAALHRHYEQARIMKNNVANKVHNQAMLTLQTELVGAGKVFLTKDAFEATGTALARTGFVILVAGGGMMTFAPSPRLAWLAQLATLDDWASDTSS
jgi:hypothetical protein